VISDTLSSFYDLNFEMVHDFGYSITEIENMIPWEREIFAYKIMAKLKEQNEEVL